MPDLDAVHGRLRDILRRNHGDFVVTKDSSAGMAVEMADHKGEPWGYVGGTRLGKRYVSYYLMTVYAQPELMAWMSPELKRRMQGKSCFNFTTVDEGLLAELEGLTQRVMPRHSSIVEASLAARPRR